MKTGCFPHDVTHVVTLALANGDHRTVWAIQRHAVPADAREVLDGVAGDERSEWDGEGGHLHSDRVAR